MINYKISADSSNAEQSYNKLIKKQQQLQERSNSNNGFISQKDIVNVNRLINQLREVDTISSDVINKQVNALSQTVKGARGVSPSRNFSNADYGGTSRGRASNLEDSKRELKEFEDMIKGLNKSTSATRDGYISNKQYQNHRELQGRASQYFQSGTDSSGRAVPPTMITQLKQDLDNLHKTLSAENKRIDSLTEAGRTDTKGYASAVGRADSIKKEMNNKQTILNKASSSNYQSAYTNSQIDPKQVRPDRGSLAYTMYERAGSIGMGITAGVAGVAGTSFYSGINDRKNMAGDTNAIALGTNTLTGSGAYDQVAVRRANQSRYLENLGVTNSQAAGTENNFMQATGISNLASLVSVAGRTGKFANATGTSYDESSALTSTYATSVQGADSKGLKDLQNTIVGGLKQSGMISQSKQQVTAFNSLLQSVTSTSGTLSNKQAQQLAVTQSSLAETGKAGQGTSGNDILNTVNSSLVGNAYSASQISMLRASNPNLSVFQAIKQGKQGITNTDNLSSAYNMAQSMGGGDDALDIYLDSMLGGKSLSDPQMKSLRKLSKKAADGTLTSSDSKKLQNIGATTTDSNNDSQTSSTNGELSDLTASLKAANDNFSDLTNKLIGATASAVGITGAFAVAAKAALAFAAMAASAGISSGIASTIRSGATRASTATARSEQASMSRSSVGGGGISGGNSGGGFFSSVKSKASAVKAGGYRGVVNSAKNTLNNVRSTGVKGIVASGASKLRGMSGASKLAVGGNALLTAGLAIPELVGDFTTTKKGSKKRHQAVGETTGSVIGGGIGTALGAMVPIPGLDIATSIGGGYIGSMIGGKIGKGIGGMFGTSKDSQQKTNKDTANLKLREKVVNEDSSVADKWKKVLQDKDSTSSSSSTKRKSSNSGSGSSGDALKIVLSGTVNHQGSVTDMSALQSSITGDTGIQSYLLSQISGNESTIN
ncbi:hypothetical protein RND61_15065 [Streptomyces sp. TRM76323]|uniref:Uncharacterized protein n=1 Tax=Streptomyces tamarix TaxID=3078565 RepID=A0ABU3QKT9_9ACTN|nr:hypothetical protein [Streptomyces tamarix]MDT9683384.1 hypothetical protein [Streptomyces tamarix]